MKNFIKTNNTRSESEGTGIMQSVMPNIPRQHRSESEGTGITAAMVVLMLIIGNCAAANTLSLFSTENETNVYTGTLHTPGTKTAHQLEGYLENGVFIGVNLTASNDSSDDGTGGVATTIGSGLDSSDDGTGGVATTIGSGLDSSDDGTGGAANLIVTTALSCNPVATIEYTNSTETIQITELYLNSQLVECSN